MFCSEKACSMIILHPAEVTLRPFDKLMAQGERFLPHQEIRLYD